MIPHDEPHRFLNWLPTRDACIRWGQWFEVVQAPYEIVFVPQELAWTIYKHHWEGGHSGTFCCEATA